jgi:hypothetical protein
MVGFCNIYKVLILTLKYVESESPERMQKETGLNTRVPGEIPGSESCFIPLYRVIKRSKFVPEALKPKPFNHYLIQYVLPLKTF